MTDPVVVEISSDEPLWGELDMETIAQMGCAAAANACEVELVCEVSILATNDARIAELNASFRDRPTPTNVLSWPTEALNGSPGERPRPPRDPEIGDIALSFETCAREAAEQGKNLHDHVTHLVVHGFLHLLGYDHETDADATVMEGLEINALETLGIENPY